MTGPHPPFNNPPIEPQFFQPSRFVISDITLGQTTIVTTTENQNYVVGQLVRLIIPIHYGCNQLNNSQGYVISIPSSTEVEILIDSSQFDSFVPSPNLTLYNKTPPQIMAIGEINSGAINSSGNIQTSTLIPGSFINISPQ